jgi:DNA polymerase I-like protein with 3'-5' exonuclease and polymerase domains/intein/homing endonuclease
MAKGIHTIGFEEFLQDKVTELVSLLPWMKETTMKLCSSIEELKTYIDQLITQGLCSLDLETTGLNTRRDKNGKSKDKIVGISLAISKNNGIYIPVNHVEGPEFNLKEELVLAEIKRLTSSCVCIIHNAKFDLQMLKNYGIDVDSDHFEDTLILARLYDAGQKEVGLKVLAPKLLDRPMIDFDTITAGSSRFDMISPQLGYVYVVSDAMNTFGLFELFSKHPIVIEQNAIYNMEKRLVLVVMQIEANLILINKPYLEAEKIRLTKRLAEIEQEVYKLVGREFNLGSTQQLGKILFDELKYKYPERTKTASGQYSTDDATLEKIADQYPIVKKLMEYRGIEKTKGTYIENILNNCDEDGCIKLSFNQNGTDTGRFSSPGGKGLNIDGYGGVNVQSIPKDPNGPTDMRKAFIPRPGKVFVAMDYSNEELRVATNLSREPKWIDEFIKGNDLHLATAKLIFKKDDLTDKSPERKVAKCVARGTLIASERGWVRIEHLKDSDRVITHTGELKNILKIWDMGKKPGIVITTIDGHKITCGLNHRFMSEQGTWVKARNLTIGQTINSAECAWTEKIEVTFGVTKIKSLKRLKSVELMDLTVEDDHTYLAEGLVTHNTVNFLVLYGGGSRGLSVKAKVSEPEAKRILSSFFGSLSTLTKWIDSERNKARKEKIARTVFGRIRPLQMFYDSGDRGQEAHADRCAVNFSIQGCLKSTERVLTNKGYYPIGEIKDIKNRVSDLKVWTGTSWENFDVLDRGTWQLATIELANGMKLDCDTRHEVLTVGKDGYEFKKFEDLNEDTKVCVSVPTVLDFGEWPEAKTYYKKTAHNRKSFSIKTNKDYLDIAYVLGYIIGDGTVNRLNDPDNREYRNTVGFCFGKEKLDKNYDILKRVFTKTGLFLGKPRVNDRSLGESYVAACSSISFIEFLEDFGYDFINKRVPTKIFTCPLEMRKAFLKGYFDTDGAKKQDNRYGFHTPNKELLQDIQLLGWSLGNASRIFDCNDETFMFTWESMSEISQLLSLPCTTRYKYRGKDMVLPKFMHHKVLDILEKSEEPFTNAEKVLLSKLRTGKNVSTQSMVQFLKSRNCELPTMYYYYKLKNKKVLNSEERTYTISVHSPLHRFDSAGIISKNTCADIMKTVMVRVSNWINSNNLQDEIKILITMHDELVFEMPADKLNIYVPKLNNLMAFRDALQGILKWPVPLTVEAKYGDSWRAKNNFFKEHPELETVEEIKYSSPTQVVEPVKVQESELQVATAIPDQIHVEPAQNVSAETSQAVPAKTPTTSPSVEAPLVSSEIPIDQTTEIVDTPEEFIYRLKSLSNLSVRRLNDILTFLTEEDKRKEYTNPVKILKLRDRDGNVLSVSNIKVREENFTVLARYFGL